MADNREERVMHAMSVDDAYRVERVLARGAGGVTELVTLDGSGPFVRKKMPIGQAKRGVWAACADCDCKRLPRIEATYELPDAFVVVYDYTPGKSVEDLIESQERFSGETAIAIAKDVCEAAGELHALGVVHRDITPANVIVAADGAHLIDLGIARRLVDGASRDTEALGTWGYAAPEQYGFAQTDTRSDIYSIGRLLAYMLTGASPADDGFDAAMADESLVPSGLRTVIARATSFEPSARYQSAEELARALDFVDLDAPSLKGAREESSDRGSAKSSPERKQRIRKLPLAAIVVVCVLVAALLVGAFIVLQGNSTEDTSGAGAADTSVSDSADSEGESGGSADVGSAGSLGDSGLTESGTSALQVSGLEWNIASDGTLIYLVQLANTSNDTAASFPGVAVTGYDSAGRVTFSNDLYFPIVHAGETAHLADITLDAESTVDVKAQVVDSGSSLTEHNGAGANAFEATDVSYSHDSLGWSTFSGNITALADAGDGGGELRVDVVMRDGEGNLVGYATAYVNRPDAGGSVAFRADAIVDSNDVISYEVYVSPWP